MQSRQYGDASVFFYDERVAPEPTGFWTRGDSTSRLAVTLAPDRADRAAAARRAGGGDRRRPTVDGDVQRVDAGAAGDARRHAALAARRSHRWRSSTEGGFVPAEVDPAARDRRRLGVWVEVIR